MERNKYIEVIDYYNRLFTKGTIARETALWTIHAVIMCALKDYSISVDDYCYILGYRDRLFRTTSLTSR